MSSTTNISIAGPQRKINKTPISRGAVFRKTKGPKVDKSRVSRGAVWEKNPKKVDRSPVARQAVMTRTNFQTKGMGKGRKRVQSLMTSKSYKLSSDRYRNNDAERTAGQKPRTAWWSDPAGLAPDNNRWLIYRYVQNFPIYTDQDKGATNLYYAPFDPTASPANSQFGGSQPNETGKYYNPIYSDPWDKDDHPHAMIRLRFLTSANQPRGGDIHDGPKTNPYSIRKGDGGVYARGPKDTGYLRGRLHRNEAGWNVAEDGETTDLVEKV